MVEFSENGRWEVCIYFENDTGSYTHGVTYYFDVNGAGTKSVSPLFDFPRSRSFIPFKSNVPDSIKIDPSSSAVILNDFDFFFHVFCEKRLKV